MNYNYVVSIVTIVHKYSYGHTMHVDIFVTCMYTVSLHVLINT